MWSNTKEQQVKDYIVLKIIYGVYKTGEMLPSEAELSKTLHVSPITIRNALRFLSVNNWIYPRQGKGYFVEEDGWSKFVSLSDHLHAQSTKQTWSDLPAWVESHFEKASLKTRKTYEKRYYGKTDELLAVSYGLLNASQIKNIKLSDISTGLVKWLRSMNIGINYFRHDMEIVDLPDTKENKLLVSKLGYSSTKSVPVIFTSIGSFDGNILEVSALLMRTDKMRISRKVLF